MGNITRGQRIGILTAGGDCPGINAAIRGVGKTAIVKYGMKVIGISDGFTGMINKEYHELAESDLSGILTLGGTILGTSREKPFKSNGRGKNEISKPVLIKEHYEQMGLDCLVCIGGNGTIKTAHLLSQEGLNVVGIPKTIDNDVWGTDLTFGFDSAVNIATEAIDRLHSTANSHKRIMIIELMGHNAGWIALYSGIAGGGDVILIPEIQYDEKKIAEYLLNRVRENKQYSIVVVAEGIKNPVKDSCSAAQTLSKRMNELTGLETRETVLGYIQRGGTPSPMDRVLATRYGSAAADMIAERDFGKMVALKNTDIISVPLAEVSGKLKLVGPNDPLVLQAQNMGTSLAFNISCLLLEKTVFINKGEMKKLIFIRHGKAEDQSGYISDFERSLTLKGKSISRLMARALKEKEKSPGIILTSPAFRALETAIIFANEFGIDTEKVIMKSDLYFKINLHNLPAILSGISKKTEIVTLFGHNPSFTQIANILCKDGCESLPKSGIVCLSFNITTWQEIGRNNGKMEYFLKPEQKL